MEEEKIDYEASKPEIKKKPGVDFPVIKDGTPGKNVKVSGKRVVSDIWLTDKDWEIKVGEIKELPSNYKDRPEIMAYIKNGKLKYLGDVSKLEGATLDEKDAFNLLDSNAVTAIKRLKNESLTEKDLKLLLTTEVNNKKRKKVRDFIQALQKAI